MTNGIDIGEAYILFLSGRMPLEEYSIIRGNFYRERYTAIDDAFEQCNNAGGLALKAHQQKASDKERKELKEHEANCLLCKSSHAQLRKLGRQVKKDPNSIQSLRKEYKLPGLLIENKYALGAEWYLALELITPKEYDYVMHKIETQK